MLQETSTLISQLIAEYGLTGLAFGSLLALLLQQNKKSNQRITDLENSLLTQQSEHLEAHKEMIAQYVELVKSKTKVIMDLTGCLRAIKDAIDRLERKQEG
jgi:hypothetical protein